MIPARRLPVAQTVATVAALATARTVLTSPRQARPAFWAGLATYIVVHRAVRTR